MLEKLIDYLLHHYGLVVGLTLVSWMVWLLGGMPIALGVIGIFLVVLSVLTNSPGKLNAKASLARIFGWLGEHFTSLDNDEDDELS